MTSATNRAAARERADGYAWPEESWDAVAAFGQEIARLYPFLEPIKRDESIPPPSLVEGLGGTKHERGRVVTPDGPGRLVQCIAGEARVVLDKEQRRASREKALPSKQQRPGVGNQPKMESYPYQEVSPEI